jgi:hypothetical protein
VRGDVLEVARNATCSVRFAHICRRFELRVPAGTRVSPYLGVTLLPRDNHLPLERHRRAPARARGTLGCAFVRWRSTFALTILTSPRMWMSGFGRR